MDENTMSLGQGDERAVAEKSTLFLIDLDYAGIFELDNIPEEHMENVLLVDCAFLLFPFARQVVADITRDGGFPPLMLEPIDFRALHLQKKEQEQSQSS
jgi:preprotein translocase subunit SecB